MYMQTMNKEKDSLAAAIAALPYRKPRAGFRGRVLAAVAAAAPAARPMSAAWRLACACAALVAVWAGIIAASGLWLAAQNAGGIAAVLADPAGLAAELKLFILNAWVAGSRLLRLAELVIAAVPVAAPSAALLASVAGATLIAAGLGFGLAGRPGEAAVK